MRAFFIVLVLASSPRLFADGDIPAQVVKEGARTNTYVIPQNDKKKWRMDEKICLTRNEGDNFCGKIVESNDTQATLEIQERLSGVVEVAPKRTKRKKKRAQISPLRQGDRVQIVNGGPSAKVIRDAAGNLTVYLTVISPTPTSKEKEQMSRAAVSAGSLPPSTGVRAPTDLGPTGGVEGSAGGPLPIRPWKLSAKVTFASDHYQESFQPDYSDFSLRADLGVDWQISPRVSAAAAGYLTVAPLSKNGASAARELGLGARGRYRVTSDQSAVELRICAGLYYRSMLVTVSAFGIKNAIGPELFPEFSWKVSPRHRLTASARFSPVFGNLSSPDKNREIGIAVEWRFSLASGDELLAGAEYTNLRINLGPDTGTLSVGALSFGYSW